MSRVVLALNVLLLVTLCVIQWVESEQSCEMRDVRAVVIHVRELRTDFQTFKDGIVGELSDLKRRHNKLEKELEELREIKREHACPDSWTEYSGSCYYIKEQGMNFSEAQDFCEQHEAHLVHVNDEAENEFLGSYTINATSDLDFWLGLTYATTEGEWRWIDDDTVATFTNWEDDQSYKGSTYNCCSARNWGGGFRWASVYQCSSQYAMHPLCEKSLN